MTGTEKRNNFNERLRKRLLAKDPAVILNEMFVRVQQGFLVYDYEYHPNGMKWIATADFDGKEFSGSGPNKHDARQIAAMAIFKYLGDNPHIQPQMDMVEKSCLGLHFLEQTLQCTRTDGTDDEECENN